MNNWINLAAVSKILIFGLILGGAVPTMFALGVRLNIAAADGTLTVRHRVLAGLSWLLFALAVVIVLTGVLYIANNFIGHHTGLYLFGTGKHH